jgi:hypothetical protein
MLRHLTEVLRRFTVGASACEVGCGSGYTSVWLSLRGVAAEGLASSPEAVERARQANNFLAGKASFNQADPLELGACCPGRHCAVIHHRGLLHRYPLPAMRALLAQQVIRADRVVFSVPSVFSSHEAAQAGERLLPLDEWRHVLEPFDIEDLVYYGDPKSGEQGHVLGVLRGQTESFAIQGLIQGREDPYPDGISAIVHTRNEEGRLVDCLDSLATWTDEIIVCDMESTDGTMEIARRYTDKVICHPRVANFDQARNVSALRARYRWVFYLDADERVPAGLGQALREIIRAYHHND